MKGSVVRVCLMGILTLFASKSWSDSYVEGVDYRVIEKKANEYSGSIVEFFSYACPFCYRAQPVLDKIGRSVSGELSVIEIPVHFGKSKYKVPAHAWFITKELGLGENVHRNIYDVVHVPIGSEWKYNSLRYMEDLKTYYTGIGVSDKEYDRALKAVVESGAVENANDIAKRYQVGGTPTFMVKGKYLVEGIDEGPDAEANLEKLLRHLISL